MTLPVRMGASAEAELLDAARWYEERRSGLGQRFIGATDDTIKSIARWPRAGSPVDTDDYRDIRRAPVSGFPYSLGYLVAEDAVYVLAVAHDRRRPGFWHHRGR